MINKQFRNRKMLMGAIVLLLGLVATGLNALANGLGNV